MGAAKGFWEEITLRLYGEVTSETLERSRPIAEAKLREEIKKLEVEIKEKGR